MITYQTTATAMTANLKQLELSVVTRNHKNGENHTGQKNRGWEVKTNLLLRRHRLLIGEHYVYE